MRLHDLEPAPGSHRPRKRVGRGNASGQGTTAGKGTKGEKARSGGLKAGFRGMSSRNQRMAKRGFNNQFKTRYQIVKLENLARLEAGATVTAQSLKDAGLVDSATKPIKILGNGTIAAAINIVDIPLTRSAREKIEAAGGSVTLPVAETTSETQE
ncbi:MAG TPA: 50S ribosomal protein L15 [Chloroflexota bacterium]|nr:50S ribosomal protein L15 [Chloroflexota bacterium]